MVMKEENFITHKISHDYCRAGGETAGPGRLLPVNYDAGYVHPHEEYKCVNPRFDSTEDHK